MRLTVRRIVVGDEAFSCEFVSKGDPPQADLTKVFDSFRLNGAGANPAAGLNPAAGANLAAPNAMLASPLGGPSPATPIADSRPAVTQNASATVTSTNTPGAAGGNFQQLCQAFRTKLVKAGPAPQEYDHETPPPGVQSVTYPSGELQLKAWIYVPPGQAAMKSPALVFFHGGFAFGADDLMACRPAMEAGMVVIAPMLRGENGSVERDGELGTTD